MKIQDYTLDGKSLKNSSQEDGSRTQNWKRLSQYELKESKEDIMMMSYKKYMPLMKHSLSRFIN